MNARFASHRWLRLASALLLLTILLLPAAGAAAEADAPDAAFDLKFSGVIDTVPVALGDPWQIAGHPVVVNASTHVRLTVGRLAAGMWADVTARRLADGTLVALEIIVRPPDVRLKGPLTAKPAEGPWVVAGQNIIVTGDTLLNDRGGPIAVGEWVEVNATEAAGALTALRIRGVEAQEVVEVFGAIQSFSETAWLLSGIPLTVTADTLVHSQAQPRLLAQAVADIDAAGGLTARVIRVHWLEPDGTRQPVQMVGIVEALPEGRLLGRWTVDGKAVEVLPSTVIQQIRGLVRIGARVQVIGWQAADHIVATHITVLNSPSGPGRPFYLRGRVEALPAGGIFGEWTVAGQAIQVNRQTRIMGEAHIHVGAPVEVGGLQYQNGLRLTTWVRVHPTPAP